MDKQVARNSLAVILPAAPASVPEFVERPLGSGTEPGLPVESLRRQIGRHRVFPRAARIVPAQRGLDKANISNYALPHQFPRFGVNHGAGFLAANLNDSV